ncbi:uncharacterized protein LOC117225507 [Megalopta genalis]|uniref:uncharacterized protein LOC117225507 n=1 Tax=Megalopta genalis TaxID=115081 RepID=UPI003FD1E384
MRVIVLVLTALAISCHAFEDDLYLHGPVQIETFETGKLVGFLEKVKQWLKTGHEKPDIPVLDPLKKDHFELDITNEVITLKGTLDDLRATGLSDYDVLQGDFELAGLKAKIKLVWPDIDLMTKYHLTEAQLGGDLKLWGTGNIMALVQGLAVDVNISISMDDDGKLYVKDLDVKIALKSLKFDATGLLDDDQTSKILSKIVSEVAPQILVDYQDKVSKLAGDLVRKVMNEMLSKLSIGDIIGMIS